MSKPYSQDLREPVLRRWIREHAFVRRLFVSVSYVSKVVGRRDATGETTARTGRAGRKTKLAPHDEAIRARVALAACGMKFLNMPLKKIEENLRAGAAGRRRGAR
jgi:hypothetical protein